MLDRKGQGRIGYDRIGEDRMQRAATVKLEIENDGVQ
jgi:hypothetical protein